MFTSIKISNLIRDLMSLGHIVYDKGYTIANGGNISARINESYIIIKKSGSSLGYLKPADLLVASLSKEYIPGASIDYSIHRAIYLNTDSKYILHVHPTNVISLSLRLSECFIPQDFESKYYLGECVPVVEGEHHIIHRKIGDISKNNNVIIEKAHGVYMHGVNVEELFYQTERLEHAASIVLYSGNRFK